MSRLSLDARPNTAPAAARPLSVAPPLPVCPACGARARRAAARFCATCGRDLREHYYRPADTLRASYHQQHHPPPMMPGHADHPACIRPRRPAATQAAWPAARADGATRLATTFATYALVPYLGILFCPGALVLGLVGCLRAPRRGTHARAAARRAVLFACAITTAQLCLWWLLYRVRAIS
ncbi:MAG TPA: hypothetical protein VF546_08095 [Pyrinomonadaceae bacterium]|jgi:ribosomal protein L32